MIHFAFLLLFFRSDPFLYCFRLTGILMWVVTIYGSNSNDLVCSSTVLEIAEVTTCYNSSWVYLSVDGCTKESTSSTSTSATASNTASSDSSSSHAGAIAGGVVGGVAAIAALLGMWYFLFRKGQKKHDGDVVEPPPPASPSPNEVDGVGIHELPQEAQKQELENSMVIAEAMTGHEREKVELEDKHMPFELDAGNNGQ